MNTLEQECRAQGKGALFAEVKELLSSDRDAPTYAELGRKLDMGEGALRMIVLRLRYQLLTGRPPFLADTLTQTLRLETEAEIVSPRLLNPGVPRDLETICTKCLEKYPQRRYTSAQELAEELERFLHDEPIRAMPVGPVGKVACWCRRKPALAAGISIGTVLLLLVAIGSPIAVYRINAPVNRRRPSASAPRRPNTRLSGSFTPRCSNRPVPRCSAAKRASACVRSTPSAMPLPSQILPNFAARLSQRWRSQTSGSTEISRMGRSSPCGTWILPSSALLWVAGAARLRFDQCRRIGCS